MIVRTIMEEKETTREATQPPACPGRHEYVIAFAPGGDGKTIAAGVMRILTDFELCVEMIASQGQDSSSADESKTDLPQSSLLVTTSAAQFDQQAEQDSARKWTKEDDHITGQPRQELFTRARCTDFAGDYVKGELLHEYGSVEFYTGGLRCWARFGGRFRGGFGLRIGATAHSSSSSGMHLQITKTYQQRLTEVCDCCSGGAGSDDSLHHGRRSRDG